MLETRRIGALEVTIAGLGGNNFGKRLDLDGTRRVVAAALAAGVTLFDTADIYGGGESERFLGRALGARRSEVLVATKFGMSHPAGLSGGHPSWVAQACDESLARLETDYLDLYLLHQPDPDVPLGETLAAMNRLLEQGKVREIGCSNFSGEQLDEAAAAARERGLRGFACVQNEYSLLERAPERGVLEACARLGMAFVPYFPLASGLLSGKYRRGRPVAGRSRLGADGAQLAEQLVEAAKLDVVERLAALAAAHGHSLLELAQSWLASHESVASIIAGAMTPEQVRANVAATTAWPLTARELAQVDLAAA